MSLERRWGSRLVPAGRTTLLMGADARAQARLIRCLTGGGARAKRLAARLAACDDGRRCQSGACLHCGRELQRAHARLVEEAIRKPARSLRNRASFTTLVPAQACVEAGELTPDSLRATGELILDAAKTVRLGPTVVGIEASCNVDLEGEIAPNWMPHGHGIHLDWLSAAQERGLGQALAAHERVKRPVQVVELDERAKGSDYAAEPDRFQRESYLTPGKQGCGRRPHRNTRYHSLRREQPIELALVEHELGLRARVLTHEVPEDVAERHLGGFKRVRDGP